MKKKNIFGILVGVLSHLLMGGFLCAEESPQQFQGFNLQGYADGGEKSWDLKGETADIVGNIIKLTNSTGNTRSFE